MLPSIHIATYLSSTYKTIFSSDLPDYTPTPHKSKRPKTTPWTAACVQIRTHFYYMSPKRWTVVSKRKRPRQKREEPGPFPIIERSQNEHTYTYTCQSDIVYYTQRFLTLSTFVHIFLQISTNFHLSIHINTSRPTPVLVKY